MVKRAAEKLPAPPQMPWTSLEEAITECEETAAKTVGRYVVESAESLAETVRPVRKAS